MNLSLTIISNRFFNVNAFVNIFAFHFIVFCDFLFSMSNFVVNTLKNKAIYVTITCKLMVL